ncbi:MAG: hypothetical protein ABH876_01335 [Patescibacteria group bacterium]
MIKKFVILIISFISFISIPTGGGIEAKGISVFVSPPVFEIELKPGENYRDEIYLLNKSELALPIESQVVNFSTFGETGSMNFDSEEEDISINPREWIKIEKPNFILEPNQSEKIKFEISLPENVEPGGHYATILFEPKLPSFYFEEKDLKTIPQIGVLFLISIKTEGLTEPQKPLTIVEFNIPENFHLKKLENFLISFAGIFTEVQAAEEEAFSITETSHLSFTLRIQNNDIYHTKPEGKLLILSTNGKIVGETEIKETTILPGKIRSFPIEFKPDLPEKLEKYLPSVISDFISRNFLFGKYRASLYLTTENDIIAKNIEFFVFPWKIALTVLFIVIILILIRRRIVGAVKVLMSPKLKIKN